MERSLKQILSAKASQFCQHSTLHGTAYLLQRGRWPRAFWSAIMAAGITLCAMLSHVIWVKFNKDPTVTVVESTHYSTERIPFPAVVICDPDLVYGPKTSNISHVLATRGYDESQIEEFFASITDIKLRGYKPPTTVKKMHALLEDLGFTLSVLHEMLRKPCDVVMVSCAWRTKSYPCMDMFREVQSVVGHCCQFDMAYFKNHAPKNMTFTSGKEPTEGLNIVVDGTKVYPNGTATNGTMLLYIFDAANTITMIDSSITLAPASYFDVDMEIYAIDSSPHVKALALNSRKCVLNTDKGKSSSFYQKCISTHMLTRVVEYCKCLPFEYQAHDLNVPEYQACTWERYLCIYDILENTHADMNSVLHSSSCHQKCDYIEYETEVDHIKRERYYGHFKNNSNTRVTIHYSGTTCIKYRREVLYTWDQMLANLGGIFGLCLGGSLISIIEIVWFLCDLLVTITLPFTKKNKLKPTTKKVALVNQKAVSKKNYKNKDGCYNFAN